MPQQQTPQELCQLESKSQTLMVKKESKKKKKELRNQSPGLWAKHCHEVLVRVMIFFFFILSSGFCSETFSNRKLNDCPLRYYYFF